MGCLRIGEAYVTIEDDKNRAMMFVGFGMAGPGILGGSLLLLYEVAMALFIGLGPIFILMLLFDATKQMFWKWLWYGIGTLFSMAVLAAMVSISLDVVWRVAEKMWKDAIIGSLLGSNFTDGISSVAMQQGGLGLILSTLILGTPPIAAMFFQGTLANFAAYNAVGQQVQAAGAGAAAMRPDGRGGMMPMSGGVVNQGPAQAMQRGQVLDRSGDKQSPDVFSNQASRVGGNSAPAQPERAIPQKTGKYTPPPFS